MIDSRPSMLMVIFPNSGSVLNHTRTPTTDRGTQPCTGRARPSWCANATTAGSDGSNAVVGNSS